MFMNKVKLEFCGWFKDVSWILKECFKGVASKCAKECFKKISKMFQGRLKSVLRKLKGISKILA